MDIDPSTFYGSDAETHLDIRKNKFAIRQTTGSFGFNDLLIGISTVVIGHANGTDLRCRRLQRFKIGLPFVAAFELIVQNRSRRMDVRLPTVPMGAGIRDWHMRY